MADFDLHSARAAGYTDAEIGQYLQSSGRTPSMISDMLSKAWDAVKPQPTEPTAYTRITHTPVIQESQPAGMIGHITPDEQISVDPLHVLGAALPHESAHVIYNQAGLKNVADQLLPDVPPARINTLRALPLYSQMRDAGSPEQLTDEGLAFTIGQPWAEDDAYVRKAAGKIDDPDLRKQLLRLHANRQGALRKGIAP